MNNKIVKKLKLSLDLVNIFNAYVKDLDNYFSIEENKLNNPVLFNLYNDLKVKIFDLAERYGIK